MKSSNQFSLLKQRRFGPFFWTQFLGAFNDNTFKNALIILITYQGIQWTTLSTDTLVNLCAGLFILPYFLFSATAGQIADKFEKSRLIRYVKLWEILVTICAGIGFYLHSINLLLFVLFMLGMQSSFFGPVKYSILPQHLRETELVGGNGMVEMGTFLAILLGTLAGGLLISINHFGPAIVTTAIFVIALLGWGISHLIPMAHANEPSLKISWNIVRQTWRNINFARGNRTVFLSILGISWFWFYGAVFLTQTPLYSKIVLGGDEHVVTILLLTFSMGIGLGSLLCERLSGHKIEIGLVPFGSIGLSVFAIDLYFAHPSAVATAHYTAINFFHSWANWHILIDLLLIGMFGGFYIVPLYALIQTRSKASHRSRIIAANNIFNALFMVVAALYGMCLLHFNVSIPILLLITSLLNILVAIYIYSLVPEFLMRFIIWLWMSLQYRITLENVEENIPDQGPAVIICNHVSFVDALIIMASSRRPIRFVMDHQIFKTPVLSFLFKTNKAIPIAPAKENPTLKQQAFDDIAAALEAGELVGIFPEGKITHDGKLNDFKPGIEQIIQRTPVPVVPLALRGLWGSFFSRKHGKAMSSIPRRFRSRITLTSAPAIPAEQVSAAALQAIVSQLLGE